MAKELKEVVRLVAHLGNAIGKSLADGKVSLADMPNFLQVMSDIPSAMMGIQNVPKEILTLTEEDKDDLRAYAFAEFDIPQEAVESVVEYGIDVAIKLVAFAPLFRKR